MKKILVLLSFIAFFFSCTRESYTPEKNEVLVSFAFNPISETGSIQTRSFLDEIIPNLVYKTPTKVYLRGPQNYILDLSSKTTYSIQPGQYCVFSEVLSSSSEYQMDPSTSVSDYVPLRIKHEGISTFSDGKTVAGYCLDISENTTNILLDTEIASVIFACKKDEVSYFKWGNQCTSLNDKGMMAGENYYYYIVNLAESVFYSRGKVFQRTFVELGETEQFEKTTINFDVTFNLASKFLVFSPNEKNMTSISFNAPDSWTEEIL